jgi:hypothetical protein
MKASTEKLINTLIEQQVLRGLNDAEFAGILGISRTNWILTKSGDMSVGISLFKGILNEFPGLKEEVLAAIREYERKRTTVSPQTVSA